MAWRLEVDGDDVTQSVDATHRVQIELGPLNERDRLTFTCKPGYLPNRLDEVYAYKQDGTTLLFGGIVLHRSFDGMLPSANPGYCEVSCVDFFAYTDWCYTEYASDVPVTVKEVLEALIAEVLTDYGFTLDAGQVDGPSVDAVDWSTGIRVSDALREIFDRTGYVVRVSPDKKIRMFLPGSEAAPHALTDAAPHCRSLRWSDPDDMDSNHYILDIGPTGTASRVQEWTADGVDTTWEFDVPIAAYPPLIYVDDGVSPFLGTISEPSGGGQFEIDLAANRLQVGTYGTPAAGVVLRFGPSTEFGDAIVGYTAQYPFRIRVGSGSPAIYGRGARPDILEPSIGTSVAEGLLAQINQSPLTVEVESLDSGWEPGQSLSIALTERVTGTYAITTAAITLISDEFWVYNFEATETTYQGSYLTEWRQMLGGNGASSVSAPGGSTLTVAANPFGLGGSRDRAVTMAASPAWHDVVDFLDYYPTVSYTGRIRGAIRARNTGVEVTLRLLNVTDSTSVESDPVEDTDFVDVDFTATITNGKHYKLQVYGDVGSEDVYGIATLQSL